MGATGQRNGLVLTAIASAFVFTALPSVASDWTLYDGADTSFFVPFEGTSETKRSDFRFELSINGSKTRSLLMDTGSTGIVVDADSIPNLPKGGDAAWVFYNSSGLLAQGELVEVPVKFVDGSDGKGGKTDVTATIEILAVTKKTCLGVGANAADCDENNPIAMMGVGFDRNTLGISEVNPTAKDIVSTLDAAPPTPQRLNPLVNLDAMQSGKAHRGYIVTKDGIILGLTSDNTDGYAYGKLEIIDGDSVKAGAANEWQAGPMAVAVGKDAAFSSGILLADTGVTDAFIFVPGEDNSGPVDAGEQVAVELLNVGDAVSYTFAVGDKDNPQTPENVTWVQRSEPGAFINTGINFYDGFDYLYDAENGFLGLKPNASRDTITFRPVIGATGAIAFQDAFSTSMEVYLTGTSTWSSDGTATFSGALGGPGTLGISGGTIVLAGDNTFEGATTVSGGTLSVTGSLAGSVTTQAAGTLSIAGTVGGDVTNDGTLVNNGTISGNLINSGTQSGTGTVAGSVTVAKGGSVAPGNSVGTITVGGDFAFKDGARHEVDVTADGVADLIDVTGNAQIEGGTVLVSAERGYAPTFGERLVFIEADGGITGRHAELDGDLFDPARYPFLATRIAYDDRTAALAVGRSDLTFAEAGATGNQRAVGGALDGLSADDALVAPLIHGTFEGFQAAADTLSGEIHASAQSALLETARPVRQTILSRVEAAFDAVSTSSADRTVPSRQFSTINGTVWGSATGASISLDGPSDASDLDIMLGGVMAGIDVAVTPSTRAGVAAGYGHTGFDADGATGSGDADTYTIAAYAGFEANRFEAIFGGAYSWHDVSTERTAILPGLSERLSSDYDATTGQLFAKASVGLPVAFADVRPFGELALVHVDTDGFTETGGEAALTGSGDTHTNVISVLGLQVAREVSLNGTAFRPSARIGWEHAFGDVTPDARVAFQAGGNAFNVSGTPTARNVAVLGVGLEMDANDRLSMALRYDGRLGSGTSDHAATGRLSLSF